MIQGFIKQHLTKIMISTHHLGQDTTRIKMVTVFNAKLCFDTYNQLCNNYYDTYVAM